MQLLWREFFYTAAFGTPNFDQMKNNRICKQVQAAKRGKVILHEVHPIDSASIGKTCHEVHPIDSASSIVDADTLEQ